MNRTGMKKRQIERNKPAHNGRFGVMAAIAPQKRQCEIETLYPAGSLVEAATTSSRLDVRCKRATAWWARNEKPEC